MLDRERVEAKPPSRARRAGLTAAARERLRALALVTNLPAYQLLERAFWLYWSTAPSRDVQEAERIADELDSEAPWVLAALPGWGTVGKGEGR